MAVLGLAVVDETEKPELESMVTRAVYALEVVGKSAIKSELEKATKGAVHALIALGKTAAEKNLENVLPGVVESFEELLKTEYKIVVDDMDLQKFLSKYNLQLEKIKRGS